MSYSARKAKAHDGAVPNFYMGTEPNPARTKTEGRAIFDEIEMVEMRIPGDKTLVLHAPVEDKHRERWAEEYAAFKRGEQRAATGTPLEHWAHPAMTRGRVAELKASNILSVDELALVPDNLLAKLGGTARAEREAAIAFIESAKGGADFAAQADKVAKLEALVEQLLKAQSAPPPAPVGAVEKPIEDASDDELRAFIAREEGPHKGRPLGRDKLLERATAIAEAKQEAA